MLVGCDDILQVLIRVFCVCWVDATAADQGLEKVRLYCAGAVGLAGCH